MIGYKTRDGNERFTDCSIGDVIVGCDHSQIQRHRVHVVFDGDTLRKLYTGSCSEIE